MGNLAETVKKQTDRILRQRSLNQTEGVVVSGVSSGTGAPAPTVNNPPADLTTHKASADHDGRYYTEAEVEALIDALTFDLTTHKASADHDGRYYTEAEVDALIASGEESLGFWEPITNGDATTPELLFYDGDVIMGEVI